MIDLPLPARALNLARRVLQLLHERRSVTVTILVIDGRWYATFNGESPENLG